MTFEEFQEAFTKWSIDEIEAKKIDGWPVCPYAKQARVQNKIQFIDASIDPAEIRKFDSENFEIGIAWLDGADNLKGAVNLCKYLSEVNPHLLYFKSTPESGFFTKNVSNCIFIQLKGDILEKREHLLTTTYYDSWPAEYFEEITGLQKD